MKPLGMVFDIETIPTFETLDMAPPEEFLVRGARSNYKPETLEKHKAAQAANWPDERVKMGSLDWRYGQILTIGVGYWDSGDRVVEVLGDGEPNEREVLRWFWEHVALHPQRHQVGFCCRDFDCPWILFRSAVNGITPARIWQTGRYTYNGPRVDLVDLADVLGWFGKFDRTGWTLDQYCEHFGTEHRPIGKGADVFAQWQAGEYGKIFDHQLNDIYATMDLYELFSGVVV